MWIDDCNSEEIRNCKKLIGTERNLARDYRIKELIQEQSGRMWEETWNYCSGNLERSGRIWIKTVVYVYWRNNSKQTTVLANAFNILFFKRDQTIYFCKCQKFPSNPHNMCIYIIIAGKQTINFTKYLQNLTTKLVINRQITIENIPHMKRNLFNCLLYKTKMDIKYNVYAHKISHIYLHIFICWSRVTNIIYITYYMWCLFRPFK